jgi:hypothetical protein
MDFDGISSIDDHPISPNRRAIAVHEALRKAWYSIRLGVRYALAIQDEDLPRSLLALDMRPRSATRYIASQVIRSRLAEEGTLDFWKEIARSSRRVGVAPLSPPRTPGTQQFSTWLKICYLFVVLKHTHLKRKSK